MTRSVEFPVGTPVAGSDGGALEAIVREPLLVRAGAWLGGFFRRRPDAVIRPPFEGAGFKERLVDVPVPAWPYPADEERSREVLDLFVRAGLIGKESGGRYLRSAGGRDRLEALLLYHNREVENLIGRYPVLAEYVAGRRVLDAGCGVGAYSLHFRDLGARTVHALDLNRDRVAVTKAFAAASGGGVSTFVGSIERLPLPDASIDLIHSRVVLPYVHQRRTMAEFARVLSPGGRAVLMLHAARFYLWQLTQIRIRRGDASAFVLAILGLAGGALFSVLKAEPRWSTGHSRFYLSYQARGAFSSLVESCGLRVDHWDSNGRKPIAWLSKTA